MSVHFQGNYLGNKKVELIHEPSGTKIISTAPADNGGDGSSFSPTDLCAVSLGGCVLMTIAIFAERTGIEISGMSMKSEKIMSAEPPRRIAKIPLTIHLPENLSAENRSKLEKVAHTCPVHKSLGDDVLIEMQFVYDI